MRFSRNPMWTVESKVLVARILNDPKFALREVKDSTALDILDKTAVSDPATALKGMKDALKSFMTDAIDGAKSHATLLDQAKKEAGEAKTASADTIAKLTEIGSNLAKSAESITKLQSDIKSIESLIARPEFSGTKKEKEDKTVEDAMELIKQRHYYMHPDLTFDEKRYDLEEVKTALKAMERCWRFKANERHETHMSAGELKALQTISTEGYFFVRPAMSARIITCQTEYSQILDLFTNETIANASIQYMVDNDDVADGGWACETNCNVVGSDLVPPGLIEIAANEIHKRICITHKMLEDSAVDMEAYATRKIGRKFAKDINDAVVSGAVPGKPQGILTYAGFNKFQSGSVAGTPAGQFTWQDLVMMFYSLEVQWQPNATWLMNRQTLGKLLTMSDGEGRPIWTAQIISAGGAPQILGRPIRIVTQMPNVATGTNPVAIGDWKEAYTVVNRLGITTLRDPYSKAACGVVWTFRQRIGGGVTCPRAAVFMVVL